MTQHYVASERDGRTHVNSGDLGLLASGRPLGEGGRV